MLRRASAPRASPRSLWCARWRWPSPRASTSRPRKADQPLSATPKPRSSSCRSDSPIRSSAISAARFRRGRGRLPAPPLADGPWVWPTMEQRDIKVSIVTRGLSHPWSLAFLPDGSMLITEKIGRLRIVRNGVLDPNPVAGVPAVLSRGTMAGLMDIALHPDFAQNKWVYISYHKPIVDGVASNSILRGTWDGKALTDVKDVFVSDDVDMEASRITFGRDGMLYMGIGGPGTGPHVSVDRAQHTDDHAGKVLRLKDDGSVPAGQPVRREDRLQDGHLHDGASRAARVDAESFHRRDLGARERAEWRRRAQYPEAGEELRVADRQLRSRLQRPALPAVGARVSKSRSSTGCRRLLPPG